MRTNTITHTNQRRPRPSARASATRLMVALAAALAALAAGLIVNVTGPAEAAGAQWFQRTCWPQSGDRQMDRQLCRQHFERDLNNWGELTVHSCWSSTTSYDRNSYYSSAGCYVPW